MGSKICFNGSLCILFSRLFKDAIAELDRFLKVYPKYKNLDYVYYLLGISYYEQIVDEKKDLQSIIKAKQYFEKVINDYPKTSYALDAEFKIDLINDLLASKEMYIGRYYFEKKKWIPAINRFKTVVIIMKQLYMQKKHYIDWLKFTIS